VGEPLAHLFKGARGPGRRITDKLQQVAVELAVVGRVAAGIGHSDQGAQPVVDVGGLATETMIDRSRVLMAERKEGNRLAPGGMDHLGDLAAEGRIALAIHEEDVAVGRAEGLTDNALERLTLAGARSPNHEEVLLQDSFIQDQPGPAPLHAEIGRKVVARHEHAER